MHDTIQSHNRLPILQRAHPDMLPGFNLTQRDIAIVEAVYTYRALTTTQIETLFAAGENGNRKAAMSRIRHRLKMLFHHGFLFRDERPTRLTDGRKPLVYYLDRRGAELLASLRGVSQKEIDWKARDNNVGWMFLEHLLATNDVRIAIELSASQCGAVIEEWLDERTLKRREMRDTVEIQGPEGCVTRTTIVPDAYFRLVADGYEYHHLLEVDMGTETVQGLRFSGRDFARKFRGYVAYYESGCYHQRYGTDSLRVLTVTTGKRRLFTLKAAAQQLGFGNLFLFTTFEKIAPTSVMNCSIWFNGASSEEVSLIL